MSPLNTVQRNVLFETQLIPQQEPLYKLREKPSNQRPEGPRRGSQVTQRGSEVTQRGSQVTQRGSQVTGGYSRAAAWAGRLPRGDGRDGDAARHLPRCRGAGLARLLLSFHSLPFKTYSVQQKKIQNMDGYAFSVLTTYASGYRLLTHNMIQR